MPELVVTGTLQTVAANGIMAVKAWQSQTQHDRIASIRVGLTLAWDAGVLHSCAIDRFAGQFAGT